MRYTSVQRDFQTIFQNKGRNVNKNQFMVNQYLAALNNEHAFTKDMHLMREEALVMLPELLAEDAVGSLKFDNMSLDQLMTAYFMCTYCHTPKKHEIKKAINWLLRTNMLSNEIDDEWTTNFPKPLTRGGFKPRVIIVTNHFRSDHVMYRCFAKSLRAMKEKFECINLCLHNTDAVAAQCFHRVVQINHSAIPYLETVRQLKNAILEIEPDVIVYADIAMHPYCVFLSNLRLAPLQVLLAGHPAPSQSKQIDAFICEDAYARYTVDFVEPVVTFPTDRFSVEAPKTGPLNLRVQDNGPVRIVVPCSLHKVTYPFLQSLRTIQQETGAEIHMTSNITKGNEALGEMIREQVPGLTYYPALHYDDFIKLISMCDMFLMPYPFNGFSTILDCFTQGVPGVVLEGSGIESKQGCVMIERGGGSSSVITHNEKSYIATAIDIANDHDLRNKFALPLFNLYDNNVGKSRQLFTGRSDGIANTIQKLIDRQNGTGA